MHHFTTSVALGSLMPFLWTSLRSLVCLTKAGRPICLILCFAMRSIMVVTLCVGLVDNLSCVQRRQALSVLVCQCVNCMLSPTTSLLLMASTITQAGLLWVHVAFALRLITVVFLLQRRARGCVGACDSESRQDRPMHLTTRAPWPLP